MQWWIKNLLENSLKDGWTHTKYIAYKKIKQNIIKGCIEQNIKNTENKVKGLNTLYNDPQKFGQDIKILRGSQTNTKPYIIQDKKKVYRIEEKEQIFRDIWSNVFRISPTENLHYDKDTEILVNNYINNNKTQILPSQQGNPNNLNKDTYYTAYITLQDIKQTIKQLKKQLPWGNENK